MPVAVDCRNIPFLTPIYNETPHINNLFLPVLINNYQQLLLSVLAKIPCDLLKRSVDTAHQGGGELYFIVEKPALREEL